MDLDNSQALLRAKSNRMAWIGFAGALPLATLAAMMRTLTGVPGYGRWFIYACVVIVVIVLILIRKDERCLNLSLNSSGSAICLGAALGFFIDGCITGKSGFFLLAGKWALVTVILSWLFYNTLDPERLAKQTRTHLDETLEKYNQPSLDALAKYIGSLPELERKAIIQEISEGVQKTIQDAEGLIEKGRKFQVAGLVICWVGVLLVVVYWIIDQRR